MLSPFDIRKQLAFYGAYHNNPVNIGIHLICIPLLVWSFEILTANIPLPDAIPPVHYKVNDYLIFDLNFPALWAASYVLYYLILDPIAAISYIPPFAFILLSATAVSYRQDAVTIGGVVHAVSWCLQFLGHGLAEKRAPALLDNLLGAVVLAPFFAHLEILFSLGYRPQLHRDLQNAIGMEIARVKKLEGDKKRASAKKNM
ncbi:hypothetical protein NM688_g5066 [Phlebia brevispora]|uniref:Uncharacterized protein n=1 Tax=Phlebia brevispora TaxID=194682 RepID=A0ACC1T1A6_9APHY|nr:hypothetical protein NM688_g5066 [Phlebia brevispora]